MLGVDIVRLSDALAGIATSVGVIISFTKSIVIRSCASKKRSAVSQRGYLSGTKRGEIGLISRLTAGISGRQLYCET